MPEAARYEKHLFPADIVEQARRSRETFVALMDGVPMLLVKLDKLDGDLAVGLGAAPTSGGTRLLPTIGFNTIAADTPSTRRGLIDAMSEQISQSRPGVTPARLLAMIERSPYFLAPLRKRAESGKPFEDRISVGRARNNDIVLRHESISKFHAYFQLDEDDCYYIGDGNSRNGTRVNGAPVKGMRETPIELGDQLRFGDIEAVFVDAVVVWETLAAARGR